MHHDQEDVRNFEEESRRSKLVELDTQGSWTKWELLESKVTWAELWSLKPFRISFLLWSVYDTLPSSAHLYTWGLTEDTSCKLCGSKGSQVHILTGCKTAPTQGRRHDKVLLVVADTLERERQIKQPVNSEVTRPDSFVQKPGASHRPKSTILQMARFWEVNVEVGRKLQLPDVVHTSLLADRLCCGPHKTRK